MERTLNARFYCDDIYLLILALFRQGMLKYEPYQLRARNKTQKTNFLKRQASRNPPANFVHNLLTARHSLPMC